MLALTGVPGLRSVVGGVELIDVTAPHSLAVALQDGYDPVVVVGGAADDEAAATACSLLAGHRPDIEIAHASSGHAPLAVLMALVAAHDLSIDAGHGLALWRALLAESWSAAVVDSVTKISRPNPTMTQHVQSWWPRSRFVIRQEPQPRAVAAAQLATLLEDLPRGQHDLAVSTPGIDDAVTTAVLATVGPVTVLPVQLPRGSTRVHGRAERYQLALVPNPSTWRLPPLGPLCPGCGLAAEEAGCAFCRTSADPATDVRSGLTGAGMTA